MTAAGRPSEVHPTSDGRPPSPPKNFRRQKSKCAESSETRFPQVSRLYDLIKLFRGVNVRSKFRIFEKCETLNGRLPPEDGLFGLRLWGNAFQMIPDISFFDVEKKFGKHFRQKFSPKPFLSWLEDTCVLARRHMCPGQKTHLSWLRDTSVPAVTKPFPRSY